MTPCAEQIEPDLGQYAMQAAIAACHARAFRSDEIDWDHLVELYDRLAATTPSPIIELNRAVAVSMAVGPAAGLVLVDRVGETGTLDNYHLFHSVRADLLDKFGRYHEAVAGFERAAALAQNNRERQLSADRAHASWQLSTSSSQPAGGC
jgi:predicted RNA polymerase sigma factor